ncbi:MAG: dihydrofolate reductase [Reichenbachiella sp.]|uniref:dipeptidyl-peptidase 3 family protein n=1 Tax=Reichenbachiella sp. TaxID=2184521 RepID=UPI002966D81C|nr:dihydrofolate reductase [Reichenbachiella sp.]MDW3210733.1 dihydrofolate reductase [Reichenbachiella sp.]
MRKQLTLLLLIPLAWACTPSTTEVQQPAAEEEFVWKTEQFADLKIIRYQIPGFEKLTLDQKKLAYYLTQAGLAGRDIIWDQNYRHNLAIRSALENIINNYDGDQSSEEWKAFMTYTKRVWFSNGIHHHYSMAKIEPGFNQEYFQGLLDATNTTLAEEALNTIFDLSTDAKKVNLDPEKGLMVGSATNFYDPDITAEEVDEFYTQITDRNAEEPISYGLNSKLIRDENGQLKEEVWKSGGMYGSAIDEMIGWLEKATTVAENPEQKRGFELLIEYFKTGSLKTWDEYNVVWAAATKGDIDYILGFIEVYNDPKGYRGSYEAIIQINDFEASERMKVLSENAQWFEDNSPIMDEHKKENVVGVSYKVVNVAGESGDASPSTPIGVNLPNANWIRAKHGSKSVSLGNIIDAYDKAGTSGFLAEFAFDEAEMDRARKHGEIGDKMHTALHEVIGHASGRLNPSVGTPKETLKNYASTIEEGRADLVGLYYLMDPKLVELGLIESLEVGKEEYDGYIRNGMMTQLRRLQLGEDIEEAHMRNRAWVSAWSFEQGQADNVIERKQKDGKTYFVVNDYVKLREIFGRLLRETQRIKSEGDYEAAKALVEGYGVKVEAELHQEVLDRASKLKGAPYGGFINPELVPVMDEAGNITDISVNYPMDFTQQMLDYGKKYAFLAK